MLAPRRLLARAALWRRTHPGAPLLLVAVASIAATFVFEVRLVAFFLTVETAVGFDDGYIAAFAERMIRGRWLPYVDAVSLRGPLLYWVSALFQRAAGGFDWTGQRAFVGAFHVLSLGGLVAAGLAARRYLAAAIGAALHVFTVSAVMERGSAFGLHGEPPAAMFATLAVASASCAAFRLREGGWARFVGWALAGALAACAGLTKQTSLTVVGPLVLWAASQRVGHEAGVRRLGPAFAVALGWTLPIALVLARYALAGALEALWYWGFSYSRVHMAPYAGVPIGAELQRLAAHHAFEALLCLIGLLPGLGAVGGLVGPARGLRARYAARGLELTLMLLALAGIAGAVAQLRFWPHHFWPAVPFLALGLGLGIDEGLRRSPAPAWTALVVLGLVGAGVGTMTESRLSAFQTERRNGMWLTRQSDPLCEPIEAHSAPGDAITIWGFDGDLYVTCRRRPATKFVFSVPVAGIVPPFWHAPSPAYVARGSQQEMAAELVRERPTLVLDMPARVGGLSLERIEPVAKELHASYCRLGDFVRGRHAVIWKRRDGPSCPPPPGR